MNNVKQGLKITVWGAIANLMLFFIKISLGLFAQSRALVADAFHTLSDLVSDVIVYCGLMFGNKGPDQNHQFGHKKIETIAEMAAGILLMGTAFEFTRKALLALQASQNLPPKSIAIAAAAISILVKEALFQWTFRVGKAMDSRIVQANAWHHRTDALSSVGVLIGLAVIHFFPEWAFLDALVGIVLA